MIPERPYVVLGRRFRSSLTVPDASKVFSETVIDSRTCRVSLSFAQTIKQKRIAEEVQMQFTEYHESPNPSKDTVRVKDSTKLSSE